VAVRSRFSLSDSFAKRWPAYAGEEFAFATSAAGKLFLAGGLDGNDGWTPCEREKPEKAGKSCGSYVISDGSDWP
jgi:hypothetical protein